MRLATLASDLPPAVLFVNVPSRADKGQRVDLRKAGASDFSEAIWGQGAACPGDQPGTGPPRNGVGRSARLTNDLLTSARGEDGAEQTRADRLDAAPGSYLEAECEDLGTWA